MKKLIWSLVALGALAAILTTAGLAIAGDLAQGKGTAASSTAGSQSAMLATDGNTQTYWQSGSGNENWLKVDFGQPMAIRRIVMFWEAQSYPTWYDYSVSNDNMNWTPISAQHYDSILTRTDFVNFTARYLRLNLHQRVCCQSVSYKLYELEAFAS